MNWDVVEVRPIGQRMLKVKFMDGFEGTICLPPAYCTGVFRPLLDDKLLDQASVAHGVVVWPNGLELAPDAMYQEIRQNSKKHYELT
jgi:hypothetical protein